MGLSSTELELSMATPPIWLERKDPAKWQKKLGGWEPDIPSGNLYWQSETYRILDTFSRKTL